MKNIIKILALVAIMALPCKIANAADSRGIIVEEVFFIESDCNILGYRKTPAECKLKNLNILNCPFDVNKVFCEVQLSICDFPSGYTATRPTCYLPNVLLSGNYCGTTAYNCCINKIPSSYNLTSNNSCQASGFGYQSSSSCGITKYRCCTQFDNSNTCMVFPLDSRCKGPVLDDGSGCICGCLSWGSTLNGYYSCEQCIALI